MSVIIKRPRALSDLAEIWDYIADDSEARADAFVATIDAKFQTLAKQPGIGRLKRLTFDIPEPLHRRIKVQCASQGIKMTDELSGCA